MTSCCRLVFRALASTLIALLALAGAHALAQAPKPGGQIVHGSVQEPDRIWGPVTGLTVSSSTGARGRSVPA